MSIDPHENLFGERNKIDLSIVIVLRDDYEYLDQILKKLVGQRIYFLELIIVDSGSGLDTDSSIEPFIPQINIMYEKIHASYPGRARNIGVSKANGKWVAFLDAKTVPSENWLSSYSPLLENDETDFVYSLGKAVAKTVFQELTMQASYGNSPTRMLPGSIVGKRLFISTKGFSEHVRSSEDLEWIGLLDKFQVEKKYPSSSCIFYYGLPLNILEGLKKYFIYGINTAKTRTFIVQKTIYIAITIVGLGVFFFKWNALFARWDMNHYLFVSHITKLYVLFIISCVLFFRGVLRPLTSGYKFGEIFPIRWFFVGIIGLLFDISKLPGYSLGYILHIKRLIQSKINRSM